MGDYSALSSQRSGNVGCFWTSRFMEITDQSSDWQATDCMCLSGSWSMGADGFRFSWCPAGCMQADCMVSSKCSATVLCSYYCVLFFTVLHMKLWSVICQRCFYLKCLCGRLRPQFNLSSWEWDKRAKRSDLYIFIYKNHFRIELYLQIWSCWRLSDVHSLM